MAKLIDRLTRDHQKLRRLLGKVKRAPAESVSEALAALKEPLLKHFQLEDAELYAVLQKASEADSRLRLLLNSFSEETTAVTKVVTEFYAKGALSPDRIKYFLHIVETRMKREEAIFFPEYERVVDVHALPLAA